MNDKNENVYFGETGTLSLRVTDAGQVMLALRAGEARAQAVLEPAAAKAIGLRLGEHAALAQARRKPGWRLGDSGSGAILLTIAPEGRLALSPGDARSLASELCDYAAQAEGRL